MAQAGQGFTLKTGAHAIPQPGKANKEGEDRYYVSKKGTCIAVFDGVGAWAKHGISAAAYAEALSNGTKQAYETEAMVDPVQIMQYAYSTATKIQGTSTGLVIVLKGNKLEAANLGDCQFVVIRKEKTFVQSKEMQVEFNTPYQMGQGSNMTPQSHAARYSIELQPDDIIVLGSDGLFDNMNASSISAIVKKGDKPSEIIAKELATRAFEISNSKTTPTPFEKDAVRNKVGWRGGKQDDITVIVGKVTAH